VYKDGLPTGTIHVVYVRKGIGWRKLPPSGGLFCLKNMTPEQLSQEIGNKLIPAFIKGVFSKEVFFGFLKMWKLLLFALLILIADRILDSKNKNTRK